MRQRNALFGALSLAVAGAAIGAGAIASSNAMADSGTPPGGATVHVVTFSGDGTDAVSCEFDDVALPTLASGAVPADVSAATGEGGGVISVSGSGPVTGTADAGGPTFTIGSDGSEGPTLVRGGGAPAEGTPPEGSLVVNINTAGAVPPDVIPDGAIVLDAADARQGTAEECAAIRDTFTPAP